MVRSRGNALRLLGAAKPLRAASGQITEKNLKFFSKKISIGAVAIAHPGPRDVAGWSMVGG
jgi:hypothetical protein